jgi:hypothetical protein
MHGNPVIYHVHMREKIGLTLGPRTRYRDHLARKIVALTTLQFQLQDVKFDSNRQFFHLKAIANMLIVGNGRILYLFHIYRS